jgi:hypothetical protein
MDIAFVNLVVAVLERETSSRYCGPVRGGEGEVSEVHVPDR